ASRPRWNRQIKTPEPLGSRGESQALSCGRSVLSSGLGSVQGVTFASDGTSGTAPATSKFAGQIISNRLRSLFHVTEKAARPVKNLPMSFTTSLRVKRYVDI